MGFQWGDGGGSSTPRISKSGGGSGLLWGGFADDSTNAPTARISVKQAPAPKSSNIFDKIKTTVNNNVIQPVVNTGKAIGDTTASIVQDASGNHRQAAQSAQAATKAYNQSAIAPIAAPLGTLRDKAIAQTKYLTGPTRSEQGLPGGQALVDQQTKALKSPQYQQAVKGNSGRNNTVAGTIDAQAAGAKGANAPAIKAGLQKDAKAKTNTEKQGAATGAAIISNFVGGGEAAKEAGIVAKGGGKSLLNFVKNNAKTAVAGGVGNAASTVSSNPNATGKEILTAGEQGLIGGSLLHGAGHVAGTVGGKIFDGPTNAETKQFTNTTKINSLLDHVSNMPDRQLTQQKAVDDTLAKIKQPHAVTEAANAEATHQAEQAVANQKIVEANQKLDNKIELVQAKAKDSKDGKLSNVDKVRVEQLKAEKQPTTAAATEATPASQSLDGATPATPAESKVVGGSSTKDTPFEPHIEGALTIHDTPEIVAKRAEVAAIPSTHLDTSPERQALREQVATTLEKQGGQADAAKAPKEIAKGKRIDLVLGAPASGKANIVDPLISKHKARLIDSDEAKGMLGNVNHATALHEESDQIVMAQLEKAVKNGENLVFPLVGKSSEKIQRIVATLKQQGYDINLHYNHLDPNKAAERAINRFHETGRFVDPHYVINQVGLKPKATYDIIKGNEDITTHTHYSNDVARGEKPRIVESGSNPPRQPDTGRSAGRTVRSGSRESLPKEETRPRPVDSTPVEKPKTSLTPTQTAHMESIDGYTHSQHMAQDYADMLREQEKGAKGGINVHFEDTGAGGDHNKRISEHSQFYRDFYAENKKAPTKADYLDQAHRELASGKAYGGASDGYKALLEREAKPVPKIEVQKTVTPAEQGTSKIAKSLAVNATKRGITEKFKDLAGYDRLTIADQAEKATKLANGSREDLTAYMNGTKPLPDGTRPTALVTALEQHPVLGHDAEFMRQLANSPLVSASSDAAQELRLAGERAAHSPVEVMQAANKAKAAAFEAKKGTTVAKATEATVKEAKAEVIKPTKETFASFIESLKC